MELKLITEQEIRTDREAMARGMKAIIDSPKMKNEFPVTIMLLKAIAKDIDE